MLGHKLWQVSRERFETYVTCRQRPSWDSLFAGDNVLTNISVEDHDSVVRAVSRARPDVVVNCVGIVKQAPAAKDSLVSIAVNSLFPHRLADLCAAVGSRLIQISTDCVFTGRQGNYREDHTPDADDLYGRSKLLGEVEGPNRLTLRTSIIGRELAASWGLVEWFLSHQDNKSVLGFRRAIFSGLTTLALSETLVELVARDVRLEGVWHVASAPISKFDLLRMLKDAYGLDVEITPDENVVLDRSLDAARFWTETGLERPKWEAMIRGLVRDSTPYAEIRQHAS